VTQIPLNLDDIKQPTWESLSKKFLGLVLDCNGPHYNDSGLITVDKTAKGIYIGLGTGDLPDQPKEIRLGPFATRNEALVVVSDTLAKIEADLRK
jgi:hypothetical protein